MTHPLFARELRLVDHRLLWWLLSMQVRDDKGVPTGTVPAGWRKRAMAELKIPAPTLWEAQERLKKAKIIECAKFSRNTRIRGQAFEFRP